MKRTSSFVLFLAAVVLFFGFAGCGSCNEPASKSVRVAISSDPKSLDPAFNTDVNGGVVAAKIFNGLVRFEKTELVGDLADSWTVSPDGLTYTFRIREGVKFHSGAPLDAAAVARSYNRVIDSAIASPRRWVFDGVASITAVEPASARELVITLVAPSASLLARLTMPAGYVIEVKETTEKNPKIVGTGPYSYVSWEEGSAVKLAHNPDYFGGAVAVEGIEYKILAEPQTALSLFKQGALEIMELPQAQLARFESELASEAEIQKARELAVVYVAVNNERFTDPRVREALNFAVDRKKIVDNLFAGLGTPASSPLPPALAQGGAPAISFDPTRAKKLLEEAKFDFSKEYLFLRSSKPTALEPSEAIVGYLRDLGVKIKIEPMEFASLREKMNRSEFDFAYQNWYGDYPDAENFLHPVFHSSNIGGAGNRARFNSKEADAAIDLVRGGADPAARRELIRAAEREVTSRFPWILLWYPETAVAVSTRLEGYVHPEIFNADKGTAYRFKAK